LGRGHRNELASIDLSVVRRRGRCGRRRMRPRCVSAGTQRVNDDHVRDTLDLHERRVEGSARACPARCVYGGSFMAAWVARVFFVRPTCFSRKVLGQIEQLGEKRTTASGRRRTPPRRSRSCRAHRLMPGAIVSGAMSAKQVRDHVRRPLNPSSVPWLLSPSIRHPFVC